MSEVSFVDTHVHFVDTHVHFGSGPTRHSHGYGWRTTSSTPSWVTPY